MRLAIDKAKHARTEGKEVTTLGHVRPGHRVNLEVDVMAKHAEKLLAGHLPTPTEGATT